MLRVEIEWLDSGLMRANGWETVGEISQSRLAVISTVGWLIHQDEESYYVAVSRDPTHEHFFGTQVVAKANARKISILKSRRSYAPEEFAQASEEEGVAASPARQAGSDLGIPSGGDAG